MISEMKISLCQWSAKLFNHAHFRKLFLKFVKLITMHN